MTCPSIGYTKYIREKGVFVTCNRLHWYKPVSLPRGDVYIANIYASNKLHEHIVM